MVGLSNFPLLASLPLLVAGRPQGTREILKRQDADIPAAFFLAGDSTTATNGGWGDGFLAETLQNGAWGTNFAKSGATTVSFRNEGLWDDTIEAVKNVSANGDYTAWVTIQFGHNDQKAAAGISLQEFSDNLAKFVDEVRDAGGYPILVSSLSRRGYEDGRVVENLANETAAALSVAEEKGALSINLNKASTDYLNAIGSEDAWTYNLTPDDRTHLNEAGRSVFGNMVAWLLDTSAQGDLLSKYTVAGEQYVEAFENGVFIAE
ncbi:putative gdsl-like lipase acylhydrolase protein [Botryosphaeria dothidea]|uniref:Gdsl-like lipase acylhydrolase protein n=1 Tax=Botryosphaeria dothidea TaxID=55169 RepID=A0A8H4IIX6_9PEZI|nr:putative gdsl-like lipase acylhydrolase protein [Botryosphaeria dothidea]